MKAKRLQDLSTYCDITAQSIQNIQVKNIFSGKGSRAKNQYIKKIAEKVLTESYKRKDGYQHDEVGILVDIDSLKELMTVQGYWNYNRQISLISINSNTQYQYFMDEGYNREYVFIHNHPNNSTVSYSDICEFVFNETIACIVAVGNNGVMHYAYKTSEKTYINLARKMININKDVKKSNILYRDIIKNYDKYNLKIV